LLQESNYVSAGEAYTVSIENNNTLFLIPNAEFKQSYIDVHSDDINMLPEEERPINDDKGMPDVMQDRQVETLDSSKLSCILEEDEDDDVVDQQVDNRANVHIFNEETTAIHLKQKLGDSSNISKLASR